MAPTPCPGLGVGFLRRAVGVRLRPGKGRDFGNKAGAGGCLSQALLVSVVEPKTPVSSEGGNGWKSVPRTLGPFTAGQSSPNPG